MTDVTPTPVPAVPVPAANLVPSAGTLLSSTPSLGLTPVNTMTQQDILIRAGKTFLQSLIPAAIVVYNAGGTPATAHHGYEAAIITAGSAALSYLWNNLATLIGKKKAASAATDAAKLQDAVNTYILQHGGKL